LWGILFGADLIASGYKLQTAAVDKSALFINKKPVPDVNSVPRHEINF
jgi:hypothetical protein